jgi:hypothetical protein
LLKSAAATFHESPFVKDLGPNENAVERAVPSVSVKIIILRHCGGEREIDDEKINEVIVVKIRPDLSVCCAEAVVGIWLALKRCGRRILTKASFKFPSGTLAFIDQHELAAKAGEGPRLPD